MSQKFAWLPVKDAGLATLRRELCVAPEYEDKAVAKLQKFSTGNDFDQYGLAAHPQSADSEVGSGRQRYPGAVHHAW